MQYNLIDLQGNILRIMQWDQDATPDTPLDTSLQWVVVDNVIEPSILPYQTAIKTGIVKDENNVWTYRWEIQDWSVDQIKNYLQQTITSLEVGSLESRGARELHLVQIEADAVEKASEASPPRTVNEVLASTPYYIKLKALDTEIRALRAELHHWMSL